MPFKITTIKFTKSSSPRFKFALQEAQKHPSCKQQDNTYSVTYLDQDVDSMHRLLGLLKNFRNRHVYIDGEEKPWDEVFNYLWCYNLLQKAYDPKQYCHGDARQYPAFNPWGCIHTNMPLGPETEWLRYGHLDLDGKTFIFDKPKIAHYLKANTHAFRFCPAMNIDNMLKILNAFPESVNPTLDRDWQYIGPLNKLAGLFVGIGILTDCDIREICGVCPSSTRAAENIYMKILKKL